MVDITGEDVRPEPLGLAHRWRSAFSAPDIRSNRRRTRTETATPAALRRQAKPRPAFPALSSMPPPRRLAMPKQNLQRSATAPRLGGRARSSRRSIVIAGALAIGALASLLLVQVLGRNGFTLAEWLTLALSALLSTWVGFGFMSAAAGFIASLAARPLAVPASPPDPIVGRTAILLPIYNEDPGLILSAAQAIGEDLRGAGLARRYDLFLLSDTRDLAVARAESAGLVRLRLRLKGGPNVYYRRRVANTDRKAGNIGDWVERHGGAYDFMLVLDADSLMSAETIAALTRTMQADASLGLVQSVPTIVNAETPFARLQQFASRLYGPMFAKGQAWWSGSEGNYWGHNAMIRVAAFAQSAGLPHLSGPKPFGGHIMSHDFIEAALLRRRGWAVRTLPDLGGSYEETPPTLLDTALRDRRWCQGNLQHARLVGSAGLHWVSRLHLVCGILAYLAPAIWLALVVCGAIIWPSQHMNLRSAEFAEVVGLFIFTLALLIAPKVMALFLALRSRRIRAGFGGGWQLLGGFALESIASILMTPVMMVMQSVAVAEVLLGRDSGWSAQRREGAELSGRDAWRAHRGHVVMGVGGAIGAFLVSKYFLMWASPVFLSLTLSALLSLHTSRHELGHFLRHRGLFQIPEDEAPPAVLERSLELRRAYADEIAARRQIEALMRAEPAVYEFVAPSGRLDSSRPAKARTRAAEPSLQPVMTW
ncbi:MAG TPA: glucans biosynthesis glucosyltransferase MdoH [Caulobacteraceae bacterium]|nr:glucans biosynthesis glucosyltransferase MdoH [Caulobacteraceae bacterium]